MAQRVQPVLEGILSAAHSAAFNISPERLCSMTFCSLSGRAFWDIRYIQTVDQSLASDAQAMAIVVRVYSLTTHLKSINVDQ